MIYTINSRDYLYLPVMKDGLDFGSTEMNKIINSLFTELDNILKYKKIKYKELKNVLIPKKNRKQILLVFNSLQIEKSMYGNVIMSEVLKCFDKDTIHSVKAGDYIEINNISSNELLNHMRQYIEVSSEVVYCGQLFLVYINNITDAQYSEFISMMEGINSYIGNIDLTYSSLLKDYCSLILAGSFIKYYDKIITLHEDDIDYKENMNCSMYDFESTGYQVLSIPERFYKLFLDYKIETNFIGADKDDLCFSIASISNHDDFSEEYNITIEDKKLGYLKSEKEGSLKKISDLSISKSELEEKIKSKIKSSYFYNLDYLDEHNVSKFNVMLETENKDNNPCKIVVALEYKYDTKELRIITLY